MGRVGVWWGGCRTFHPAPALYTPCTACAPPAPPPAPQAIDLAFLHHSLSRTLRRGVSVDLLFAFEYTVQASTIVLTFVKYCL